MTQEQFAKALQVKHNSVYNWEKGKFAPNRNNTIKLKRHFDVESGIFSFSVNAPDENARQKREDAPCAEDWETSFFVCLHNISVFYDAVGDMPDIDIPDKEYIKKQIRALQTNS